LDVQALRGEAQPYRTESYLDHENREVCFITTRQPLRDRDGKVVGMFGVARDVTFQKRAEDAIRQAVKRRDDFLAMLSHELRNPLSAIVNAAGMLRTHSPDAVPNQALGLGVIERQSRQMTRLLEDLLEVSRITQNKIELRCETLDARSIVQEAATALREKFAARDVALCLNMRPEPVLMDADPARLQQIIVNLLDNGSKYSKPGCTVELELRVEAPDIRLIVRDDGMGIDADVLSTVFDPFVQCGATLHRTEGGMGVGLTVVRSLVEMHGGKITATSAGVDRGSEFIATFPLSQARAARERPPAAHGGAPLRIVLVEDNVDSCEMLQMLLSIAGHDVATATDGRNGFDLICENRPDLAIVDVGLPLLNGFQVAELVRARSDLASVYLVALTGYGQSSDINAALQAGFDEHWVKPIDPENLPKLLRSGNAATV
jgi:two-component system CheB/CheR fusion protein